MPHTTDNGLQIAISEAKKMIGEGISESSKWTLEILIERLEALSVEQAEYNCEKCGAQGHKYFCGNCDVKMEPTTPPIL